MSGSADSASHSSCPRAELVDLANWELWTAPGWGRRWGFRSGFEAELRERGASLEADVDVYRAMAQESLAWNSRLTEQNARLIEQLRRALDEIRRLRGDKA